MPVPALPFFARVLLVALLGLIMLGLTVRPSWQVTSDQGGVPAPSTYSLNGQLAP